MADRARSRSRDRSGDARGSRRLPPELPVFQRPQGVMEHLIQCVEQLYGEMRTLNSRVDLMPVAVLQMQRHLLEICGDAISNAMPHPVDMDEPVDEGMPQEVD